MPFVRPGRIPHLKEIFLTAVVAATPYGLAAQTQHPDPDRATHASSLAVSPLKIDGRMDEPGWDGAATVALRYEVAPGDNTESPVATHCRVLHDAERLYLGCRASDPDPGSIRAYVTERDAIAGQDRIELTLVPFDDGRRGYRFSVTPLGLQADAQVLPDGEGDDTDDSWDATWASAGSLTEDGFVVEAAIPFAELRFPAESRVWGFRIERRWPRDAEVRLRSEPWNRRDACDLCQASRLTNLEGVTPGGAVRIAPTLTASHAGEGVSSVTGSVGADLLWTPLPSVAVGAALNPDFSHIEADEVRLDANERFALFVPERRPFFLEGADLFATPLRVLFTRSIADPDAAAKLTAKRGATAVGVILARDAATRLVVPGPAGSRFDVLPFASDVAVVRVRRDVGRASSVGLLATSRTGEGYANQVGSLDALLRPWPSVTARLQVAASSTLDSPSLPDAREGRFGGAGAVATVTRATREWILSGRAFWRDPGLRVDAGFEPQVGTGGVDLGVRREILAGRDSWYQRVSLAVGGFRMLETDGALQAQGAWIGGEYEGPREIRLLMYLNAPEQLVFQDRTYDVPTLYTSLAARPSAWLRLSGTIVTGRAVDFATFAAAERFEWVPRAEARLGRRVDLALLHATRRLTADQATLLDERVAELRLLYGVTRHTSIRVVAQRTRVERAGLPRAREHLVQALFAWQPDPGSVIRLGIAASGGEAAPSNTLVFLKAGFAWRP